MPCRAAKIAAAAPQALQGLWITDEILSDAFNRFLRVSHTHRRFGSNIPGPLEARRRLARRRLGLAAVPNAGASQAHDFRGLFDVGSARPPEFEAGWRWQAPVPARPPPPPSTAKEVEWYLPLFDGSVEQSADVEDARVARFFEIPEDPVETSEKAFAELLDAQRHKTTVKQQDLQPVFDFLESPENEPDARLTLRFIHWLAERDLSSEASQSVVTLIKQKIMLRTIREQEESAVFVSLLGKQKQHMETIVQNLISSLPRSVTVSVLSRTTAFILQSATDDQHALLETWLACCVASDIPEQILRSEMMASVYELLSDHLMPSDFAQHFGGLDNEEFARLFVKHWIPKMVYPTVTADGHIIHPVDCNQIWSEFDSVRNSKRDEASQNHALVDLACVLVTHGVLRPNVLEEFFGFWQQTESAEGMLNLIKQFRQTQPPVGIPPPLAVSLIQSSVKSRDLRIAYGIFFWSPDVSLSQCPDLPLELIKQGQLNSNKIWNLFDRRAAEACGEPNERHVHSTPLPQDLVHLIQEAAYAWARSPHLRPRVAHRRVWECYRFLRENGSPLSRLMSRALARAGIVNFVKAKMPVPKSRVQHILELIGQIEGLEVKKAVDRLVFGYWMATRNLTEYKPSSRQGREKYGGEQTMEDGSVRRVTWKGRVLREATEIRRAAGEEVVEDSDDAYDKELRSNHPAQAQTAIRGDDDFLYPIFGVQETQEATHSDVSTAEPSRASSVPLAGQDSLDSTYEVEELEQLAVEQLSSAQPIEDGPSATEPLNAVDEGSSVAFKPYKANEIGSLQVSSDTDTSVLSFDQLDALPRSATTSYSPNPENWTPPSAEEVIAGEVTPDPSPEPVSALSNEGPELLTSTPALIDGLDFDGLPPITSFISPWFRRLHGWFQPDAQSSGDPSLSNSQSGLTFVSTVSLDSWRLSVPAASSNIEFRSIPERDAEATSEASAEPAATREEENTSVDPDVKAPKIRYSTQAKDEYNRRRKLRRAIHNEVSDDKMAWQVSVTENESSDVGQPTMSATPSRIEKALKLDDDDRSSLLSALWQDIERNEGVQAAAKTDGAAVEIRNLFEPLVRRYIRVDPSDELPDSYETSSQGGRHVWQRLGEDELDVKRLVLGGIKSKSVPLGLDKDLQMKRSSPG